MDEKSIDILSELNEFRTYLFEFNRIRKKMLNAQVITKEEKMKLDFLFCKISEDAGKFGNIIEYLTGARLIQTNEGPQDMWSWALSHLASPLIITALDVCISATSRTIGAIKKEIEAGIRDKQGNLVHKVQMSGRESPKAFIAHGGETHARNKLYKFLIALGIKPLIIEEESYEGRSVNQQVEQYLKQADCSVILGTADDKELKDGKLYPRRNVYIEIGRFQEKFPDKIIYLLEEGGAFPSNISEKLYTRFSQDNMEEAYLRIVIELTAFGILKATKPSK